MLKNRMSIRVFTKMIIPKNPVLKKKNSAVPIAARQYIIPIPNVNTAEVGFKKAGGNFYD